MADVDAAHLADQTVRLGLVSKNQMQECRDEVGELSGADPALLLRALERKGSLTPWQSQKLLKGDREGYFLGGYRLLYKIASGSFGRVFRADDPGTGMVVAIKVLRRRWSDNPHNVELFEREGKLGMTLRHPNIVTILAVDKDAATSQYYIVMEFVEGGNLRDFLAIRKKLEPVEALRLLEDAASGLAHAFSRGMTHRDIKLTNILISSQGDAKLVDFGLAGLYAPHSFGREDENSQVDRTVDYAGLERATNVKPGDVRSDIYFLGCVLYEMLTGRSPLLMTRDKRARMLKQRFANVPPIQPDEVTAPPLVFRLVETMMSLEPRQRYQTPSQLLEAIRAARREVEAKGGVAGPKERSVFVVEKKPRLQDALRDKLKKLGYRVFLASDPAMALTRFRQQPFDALIVDSGTTGEEGLFTFERILSEAGRQKVDCAGILVLAEDQAGWAEKIQAQPKVAVLVRPVTLKELYRKLCELAPPR